MTQPRKDIVSDTEPGAYHCTVRCVRRAFLCGLDLYTGKNFEHRRQWIYERIALLSLYFAVEVISVSVMSNHLHIVLRLRPDLARNWSDEEVARRWCALFEGRKNESDTSRARREAAMLQRGKRVRKCRKRLGNLSWFMKGLNENIARRANREDKVTGRFWEGRFASKKLCDDAAILACMTYVDLNPVHAGIAQSIEESLYTGANARLRVLQARERLKTLEAEGSPLPAHQGLIDHEREQLHSADWLAALDGPGRLFPDLDTLQYLELLEWTGKQLHSGKSGALPQNLAPVLERLGLDARQWVRNIDTYDTLFGRIIGRVEDLFALARARGKRWFCGRKGAAALYRIPESPG